MCEHFYEFLCYVYDSLGQILCKKYKCYRCGHEKYGV